MMSSESESTAANSNNDEQQQIKMTRMAEWLKKADAVCFDVDSTVINTEGIDELADYFGAGEAVAKLTKEAMEGGMKFEEALDARHRRDHLPESSAHEKHLLPARQQLDD